MNVPPLGIAMLAPPWYALPPSGYGGIEAMCADLAEALVARGHEVTLIAAGTPGTDARHVITYSHPQGDRIGQALPEVVHAAAASRALERIRADVIHDHTLAGPLLARGRPIPTVVTAHNLADGEMVRYYHDVGEPLHLVAISAAQRRSVPDLSWAGTVHNAVRAEDFPYRADKEDFVLFLGRCSPDKGVHLAIDAARAAGRRIVLGSRCAEPAERAYFAQAVEPRLGPGVEWLGEADQDRKLNLLARARCLLFPVCWEEPFGMVMIEAMACGTPVVALRRGAVPEVVIDGVTGLVRDEVADLPAALEGVARIDPAQCREHVRRSFHADAMAARYEHVYHRAVAAHTRATDGRSAGGPARRMRAPLPRR